MNAAAARPTPLAGRKRFYNDEVSALSFDDERVRMTLMPPLSAIASR